MLSCLSQQFPEVLPSSLKVRLKAQRDLCKATQANGICLATFAALEILILLMAKDIYVSMTPEYIAPDPIYPAACSTSPQMSNKH